MPLLVVVEPIRSGGVVSARRLRGDRIEWVEREESALGAIYSIRDNNMSILIAIGPHRPLLWGSIDDSEVGEAHVLNIGGVDLSREAQG